MKRGILVVLMALLLTLSGCSLLGGSGTTTSGADASTETVAGTAGQSATENGAQTATEQPFAESRAPVTVTNGTLEDVNATTTFYRVQDLTGTDVRAPTVELRNLTERKTYRPGRSPLLAALGFQNASLAQGEPGGLTTPTTGRVFLHRGEGSSAAIEQLLAHEYAHTVQFQAGMLPWLDSIDRPRLTTDLVFTRKMLIEGGAVFVSDEYSDRHLDVENESADIATSFESGDASERFFWGQYHFGARYVDGQIDDSEDLATVYQDHPETTEQILHETDDDPVPQTIDQSTPSWNYTVVATDTQGEYVLRSVLSTELSYDTATDAAAGWGNDSLASFRHTTDADAFGWVWTIEMDDTSEADELRPSLERYAQARSNASNLTFETARLDEETLVLTIGHESFLNETTVDTDGETVTVRVGDESS